MTRVLVTGGTGTLGRQLTPRLIERGYTVRAMSRQPRPAGLDPTLEWARADLETGEGLSSALEGVQVIIHAASSAARHTEEIDIEGTRRLLASARAVGVEHFIYVSIVGIERIPVPYYRAKVAAEALVISGGVPYSIQRATQFHTLLDRWFQPLPRGPLVPVRADFLYQPVDPGEVADRFCDIAAANPGGRLPDMGGPEIRRMGDLLQAWLRARGRRAIVVPIPVSGARARAFRRGYNTSPEHRDGTIVWERWLETKYGSGPATADA